MSKKNIQKFLLLGIIFLFPFFVFAQETVNPYKNLSEDVNNNVDSVLFKAVVIEILEEKKIEDVNGNIIEQQNLKLKGLNNGYENKEVVYNGISDMQVYSVQKFKLGDRLIVSADTNTDGEIVYYVIDYIRNNSIYLLFFIFVFCILIINRLKGFRAIVSLFITFFVILKFILPQILNGVNPIIISILGGFFILLMIIYVTEGINRKSHLAILGIFISMIITGIFALIFSNLLRLTGISEEGVFLIDAMKKSIDFKGLLFAGTIIGALGVLDDMVVSQISAVEEIKKTNSNLSNYEVFKRAYKIGVSHVGSMTNTLFLAYAGSSLTVLLLFYVGTKGSMLDVLSSDLVVVEIFRSLIGGIGLALSMPISTFLGAYYLKIKKSSYTG
ncbi:MAG: YibE/F family protein [Patescibacteria group bacterium]|nr:YibE/F family protein [Patescibacteria group bacterium]MDD4304000.1 YibE/F family protein [Patescibacteria group bacterium]MDD4695011.1 YibE/F family protein [Patescibacteria group bacterium]